MDVASCQDSEYCALTGGCMVFVLALYLLNSHKHVIRALQARIVIMLHAKRIQGNPKAGRCTYMGFSENLIS
jgi:hypothetical protein